MELRGPKIYNWHGLGTSLKAGRHETKEKPMFLFESEGRKRPVFQFKGVRKFPLISGSAFCLISPSADWMRVAHIREGKLLYSVYLFKY